MPLAMQSTVASVTPRRSAATAAPKSISSRTMMSGDQSATDRYECIGSLARDAACERGPDRARLPLGVKGEQRQALLRGEQTGAAGGECREPRRLDRRDHPFLPRERDDVTGPLGREGNRSERQEVTGAAGEGEQNPHRVIQAETNSSSLGMMSPERNVENRQPAPFHR